MTLDAPELTTPALVLDRHRLAANLAAMRQRLAIDGLTIRPHLKTAKSAKVAEMAVGRGGPITVSTLREAEYFADHGFHDLTLAVAIVPSKLGRVAALCRRGVRVNLLLDDPGVAVQLGAFGVTADVVFDVLIEIDSGEARTGVEPSGTRLLAIARALQESPGARLRGVLTHAGQSYRCSTVDEIRAVAQVERDCVTMAARRLREAGFEIDTVSAGSTPTSIHGADRSGLTELRPGVFMFFDRMQRDLGSCGPDQIVLTVLASVVSHNPASGRIVIDAGALALSKDPGRRVSGEPASYGELTDLAGQTLGLTIEEVYQEHGVVTVPDASWFDRLPIGSRLRVLPNHACLTAAAHDRYHVLEHGEIVEEWDRANGW